MYGRSRVVPALEVDFIGKIEAVTGSAAVTRAGLVSQAIIGDGLNQGDLVETKADGQIRISFIDGTVLELANNTRIVLKELILNNDVPSATFDVTRGSFFFKAGKVARHGRLWFDTPVARIRGRANSAGVGILSLAALYFAILKDGHAASSNATFLDDGVIAYKELEHGVFDLLTKEAIPRHIIVDDPGQTVILRRIGSSISVDRTTNDVADMLRLQADQQAVLQTFALGLQQGPTATGPNGTTIAPPTFLNSIPINYTPPPSNAPPSILNNGTENSAPSAGLSAASIPVYIPAPPPPPPPPVITTTTNAVFWTSPTGGNWNDLANWSTGAIPSPSQDIVINLPVVNPISVDPNVVGPIVISAGSSFLIGASAILNLNGGSLTVDGLFDSTATSSITNVAITITSTGALESTAGALTIDPSTINNAGLLLADVGELDLNDITTFTNTGLLLATGGGVLRLNGDILTNNGGTVQVDTGSTLDLGGTSKLSGTSITGGSIEVAGLFDSAGGDSIADAAITIATGGVLESTAATLTIDSGAINSGGLLEANGGELDLENVSTFTSSGTLLATDSSVLVLNNDFITNAGSIQVDVGSTLDVDATTISGGTLGNSGTVNVTGGATSTLSGVGVTDTGGTVTVDAGSTLDLKTTTITGGTLSNSGTVDVTGGATSTLSGISVADTGAILTVDAGSTLDLNGTTITGGTITDHGLIDVTGSSAIDGSSSPAVDAALNGGMVTIESGQTLTLDAVTVTGASFTGTGTIAVDAGQKLTLAGIDSITGDAISNLGTIDVSGTTTLHTDAVTNTGALLTIDGTLDLNGTTITGGTITDHGPIDVTGGATSTLSGVGVTDTGGSVTVDAGSTLGLNGTTITGGTLGNSGTVDVTGGATSTLSGVTGTDGSVTVDAGSTLDLNGTTINGGTITDHGLIDVTGGSTSTLSSVGVTDTGGTVTVDAGSTLDLNGTTINGGTLGNSGTVDVTGGATSTLSGVTVANGGGSGASTAPFGLDGNAFTNSAVPSVATSVSLTTSNANDVIIVDIVQNGATVSSVTDTAGLQWHLRAVAGAVPFATYEYYAIAPNALSADAITVNFVGTTSYVDVNAFGVSGANTSSPFDSNASVPAPTTSTGSITTSNADDFIFAGYRFGFNATPTAGSGWTAINASGDYYLSEYQIVSTTQAGLVATASSADENGGIVDAIVRAPASAPTPPGALTVDTGSTLYLNNTTITGGTLSNSGTVDVTGGATSTLSGISVANGNATSAAPFGLDGNAFANNAAPSNGTGVFLTTSNANDVIIVDIALNGTTVSSVTDTAGLQWHLRAVAGTANQPIYEYYAIAPNALSADVIAVSFVSTATYVDMNAFGVSGANTSSPFDGNASVPASTTSTGSITTSNADDFIFAGYRFGLNATPTVGSGWTAINASGDYYLSEYQIVSTTQAGLVATASSADENGGIVDAIQAAPMGTVRIDAGSTLDLNNTTITGGAISNLGTIDVSAHVNATGYISGTGLIEIFDSATLEIGGAVSDGQTVTFEGLQGTLVLDDSIAFKGVVVGLTENSNESLVNRVDLKDLEYRSGHMSADFVSGAVVVSNGINSVTINLSGNSSDTFALSADAFGGTIIVDPPNSGAVAIGSGTTLDIAAASTATVSFTNSDGNTGELVLNDPKDFTGQIAGFAGDGTIANSDLINLTDVNFANIAMDKTTYTDNGNGIGALTLYDTKGQALDSITFVGNYQLANFTIETDGDGHTLIVDQPVLYNASTLTVSDAATLPLGGTIDNSGTIILDSTGDQTNLQIIGNGVTLQGGGHLSLSDSYENIIFGATAATALTNVDNTVFGAGQIGIGDGSLTLVNGVNGTIDADISGGMLTLNTGNAIANNGILEATNGGTLHIHDPVIGGDAIIAGGTLIFDAQSNANVTFDNGSGPPAYGELVLENASAFSGQISGFTGTSPDSAHSDTIDLKDVSFDPNTTFAYNSNAGTNTGGTLTIFESGHILDTIAFSHGGYTTANFTLSSDGSGGTLITDPPTPPTTQATSVSIGGPGGENFIFGANNHFGAETITNFHSGSDTIELDGYTTMDNGHLAQAITSNGPDASHGDAIINLGHGDSITVANLTESYLQQHLSLIHLHTGMA
jgi:FecR protein